MVHGKARAAHAAGGWVMFRIHFDHKAGVFVVQVLWCGLIWRTVCETISGCDGAVCPQRQFPTYADARLWVEAIGLADLYDEQHPKTYRQFITNGGVR